MFSKKPDDVRPAAPSDRLEGSTGSAAPFAPVAAKQSEQPRVTFRYIDRPDCTETFADSLIGLVFDGQTLRLEFAVSRLDERIGDGPITGRRYPVCRLVLPPGAAVELINKVQQVAQALAQAGVVKSQGPSGGSNLS